MPSGNWSFPCSPRNPAKVREELRLLATLVPSWRARGMPWNPRSGAQLEFGRQLRVSGDVPLPAQNVPARPAGPWGSSSRAVRLPGEEEPDELRFQRQADALTDENVRWTARARWGTYRFFGLVTLDAEGYATLTPAGDRFAHSSRPGDVLLKQLLKWQYPDYQHRGSRWPETDFAIHPFVATARLIRELGGLTRREIALFCFTMRRTEDAAATAEAIRQFRRRETRAAGRTGKARATQDAFESARYPAQGRKVALGSMADYADALVRYFRYTGLFSVRGTRIVVAGGRERELDELMFDSEQRRPSVPAPAALVQLALGEAPPVRLAAPRPLFPDYADDERFFAYYGDPETPRLPWEDPTRLAAIARDLEGQIAELQRRLVHVQSGRVALGGGDGQAALPPDYEALVDRVATLRRRKRYLEETIYAAESRSADRLREALDYYPAIAARQVIDPPTFLEWNTWRAFLALNQAREIVPHLALDDDLQPLSPAQGNQPDLEVDYGGFAIVVEVTLRTGTDQRHAEARPVTRHILDAQRRLGRPVYGLFVAPKIHPDTATDFFVALKYRVVEREQIVAIPLTLRQLAAALRPFAGHADFVPQKLRTLLDRCVAAGLESETGEDWLAAVDAALRRWLASLGAPPAAAEPGARAVPLPLFA